MTLFQHINKGDLASVQWLVATRCVGYATHVQNWIRVAYPMCPVALATGQKPHPNNGIGLFHLLASLNIAFKYIVNDF